MHPRLIFPKAPIADMPDGLLNEYIRGTYSLFEMVALDRQYFASSMWKGDIVADITHFNDNSLLKYKAELLGVDYADAIGRLQYLCDYVGKAREEGAPRVDIIWDSQNGNSPFAVRAIKKRLQYDRNIRTFSDIEEAERWAIDQGYWIEYENLAVPDKGHTYVGLDASLDECQLSAYPICEMPVDGGFDKAKEYRIIMFDYHLYGGSAKTWLYIDISWVDLIEDLEMWGGLDQFAETCDFDKDRKPVNVYDLLHLINDVCGYWGSSNLGFSHYSME